MPGVAVGQCRRGGGAAQYLLLGGEVCDSEDPEAAQDRVLIRRAWLWVQGDRYLSIAVFVRGQRKETTTGMLRP